MIADGKFQPSGISEKSWTFFPRDAESSHTLHINTHRDMTRLRVFLYLFYFAFRPSRHPQQHHLAPAHIYHDASSRFFYYLLYYILLITSVSYYDHHTTSSRFVFIFIFTCFVYCNDVNLNIKILLSIHCTQAGIH